MPHIGTSTYAAAPLNLAMVGVQGGVGLQQLGNLGQAQQADVYRALAAKQGGVFNGLQVQQQVREEHHMAVSRRLVQVVIVDPNENVPLDDCLIYDGKPKLTDATDQELFFEVDIKTLLDAHNEKRTKIVDRKVKERTEYLEPAKIRDLRMVVVEIAKF